MKPKHQRMVFILTGLVCLAVALILILRNFNDNLVFFFSPTQLQERRVEPDRLIRIGGLVEEGSVKKLSDMTTEFVLTDLQHAVPVRYSGLLPNLFREGQGMVARGKLGADGVFVADNLLAKHDEKYMPPDVAKALKKSGQWKPEAEQ